MFERELLCARDLLAVIFIELTESLTVNPSVFKSLSDLRTVPHYISDLIAEAHEVSEVLKII